MPSEQTLELIRKWEGCKLTAYKDVAGVWTIGYGHTEGVKMGDTCTKEQAEEWLYEEAEWFQKGVLGSCKIPPNSNQLTALVSFTYNLGLGNLRQSALLRKHNIGNFAGAANEFLKWNKARHPATKQLREVFGLTERRKDERRVYLTPEGATA